MYKLDKSGFDITPHILALSCICFTLSGCNDAAKTATGFGEEKFTFKGELPENFGLAADIGYYPLNPNKAECQIEAWGVVPTQLISRRKGASRVVPISEQPQSFSFDIPLRYTVEQCDMALGIFKFDILAKFGDKEWQTTSAMGSFRLVDNLPNYAPTFNSEGTLSTSVSCDWVFKESTARIANGEITKLLGCSGARVYIDYEQLTHKTVHIKIQDSKNESPFYRDTWINFENGWKPCLPKPGGSIRCQTPPVFRTFKMNGKICTIYPGCTE